MNVPKCHPDRKHESHGLCKSCYNKRYYSYVRKKDGRSPSWKSNYIKNHPELFNVPVVYVYFAPDGIADYVGRGTLVRAKCHKYISKWWTNKHLLLTMTCDSEWQAMEMEGRWGGRYLPRYNKEGYRYT